MVTTVATQSQLDPGADAPWEADKDAAALEALRSNTWGLLAALLAAPPGAELLDRLRQIDAGEEGDAGLGTAWRMLKLAAERSAPEAADDEYHALFIGIGRGELVPYASWYLTGFLMDRPLALLRRDLAALGFERQDGVSEPEDHAASLCETMAMLVAEGETALDVQRRFFEEHVGSWMDVFFQDLQQAQSACFYRSAGQLGESFLRIERRYLGARE